MNYEKSCGIVPYIVINGEILYVLITQNNGITCFPKGHVEANETEEETALRECYEETKLEVDIIPGYRDTSTYYMPEYDAEKTVVYFLGKIKNLDYHKQDSEIKDIKMCNYEEACKAITYDNTRQILISANNFLKKM